MQDFFFNTLFQYCIVSQEQEIPGLSIYSGVTAFFCWSVVLLFSLQSKCLMSSLLIKLKDKAFKFKEVACLFISKLQLYIPLTN